MPRPLWLIGVVVLVAGAGAYWFWPRPHTPPEPGIPLAMARDRAARITNLKYSVALRIPAVRTEPIRGQMTATFTLSDTAPLAFDFSQAPDHLIRISTLGQPRALTIENGHILIPSSALTRGENTVEIEFTAGDAALNRNDDYLYSLFVPARASMALPCLDQPDLKARWTLRLDVPRDWVALSNGRESGRVDTTDRASVLFDETAPLPTYLFAFAAGRFSVETAERGTRRFRMFHRETDAAKVERNRDAIFDQHARALDWMEDYTGIAYPFGKFDFVAIPSFQFGGMEHPGAVYYNANGILLDASATQNQMLDRANVIAHETSHMWFGDLVTMKWFNDVWMKEVFANFMAARIVNPSFPAVNHDLRFLLQHIPGAYEVDRTDGANPIRQALANLNEAGTLYGAIIYLKAPVVMRQLELLVGADAFREGLRRYLSAHQFGNADWNDLIGILDERIPIDLSAWSKAWVEEAGRPTIRTDLTIEKGVISRLVFVEMDPRGRNLVWPARLQVLIGTPQGIRAFDVALTGAETEVPQAAGLPQPAWVLPVGGGLGYGLFQLDEATLKYLEKNLHRVSDPLTRGAALVAFFEAMLDGRVAPANVYRTLVQSIPVEPDELNLQQMLDNLRIVFWRFTTPDERLAAARELEPILRAGLERAASTSAKSAWFNTLKSVAITDDSVGWLERVWRRDIKIPGLPLAEVDEAALALDLAVRDVPAAEEILGEQLKRFTNPDRRARFVFVIPALSSDAAVRQRFFESLKDRTNRTREAWVLDAARYLHHPLRAGDSRKLIRQALDLVPEIQRTGDIFFPKRWADATLAGYQSVQTAAEVRAFIDALPPDYPMRLRWILLSAADPLFRTARLQQLAPAGAPQ